MMNTAVPGLLLILAIFYIVILTVNYRRSKSILMSLPLFPGEAIESHTHIPGLTGHTQMLLSNRRLAELTSHWLLSLKAFRVSDLDTCDAYVTRHLLNPIVLAIGYFVYVTYSPLIGLLLILYSAVAYVIRVAYSFKHAGGTHRVHAATAVPHAVDRLWSFSLQAERVRRSIRLNAGSLLELTGLNEFQTGARFRYDSAFPVIIGWCIAVAIVQRLSGSLLGLDDNFFGPLYLAAPIAAGLIMRPAQAALVGFFGFWAVFTVGCPVVGSSWSYAAGAPFDHLLLLSLAFAGIAGLASAIANGGSPAIAPISVVVWAIAIAIQEPRTLRDLSLYGQMFLAIGLGVLGSMFASPEHRSEEAQPPQAASAVAGSRV
jgi:hypothetical protein